MGGSVLTGRDILCISSIDWDFIWQGHQEIMTTLAEVGNRVLFVENTGVRSPRLRDLPRLRRRVRNWWQGTKGFRQVQERLFVYSPLILPFPYSRVARWLNRWILVRALQRWMVSTGFRRPIVWTFLPTPLARDVIRRLEPDLTVYYCIDDLSSSSDQARKIVRSEERLLREVDLVFVTSEKLRQRAARFRGGVHLFPFGVSYGKFEAVREAPTEMPDDIRPLRRPIVGYVGGVHQWVDQDLLAAVAGRLPDATFVLVGPAQSDVSRLTRAPNVHLLGPQPHTAVPRYVKAFDVGIIPYRLSDYTTHVYPTKLNEYLAMGIPVVATALPEVQRFNAEHGEVVTVAHDPEAFAAAIRSAIATSTSALAEWRSEVARQNSWEARIAQMCKLVEDALMARRHQGEGWERSLRRLYRTARLRVLRGGAAAIGLYLVLFHTPVVWVLAEPLRVAESPRAADAIVVFAGGVGESGKAGGGHQERVHQAVELYRAGYAPYLIFSSGYAFAFAEAEIMKTLATAQGVPSEAIILEQDASNTHENVAFVRSILERRGWRRILLVSSPYHMRRALWTFRKVAPTIEVIAAPVPRSQFYAASSGPSLEQIGGIVHEYSAISYYVWKGWI